MKQHLRKLSALLLTFVLAISLAPAALAAPANTDITFDGVMAGDTVTAYPMVTYDATYSSFTYHPAFKTFLEGKKGAATGTLDAWFSALASDVLSGYLTEYTEKVQAGTAGYDLPTAKVDVIDTK